jgi:hypothetical protein
MCDANYRRVALATLASAGWLLACGCTPDRQARIDRMTVVVPQEQWPAALIELLGDARKAGIEPKNVVVYFSSNTEYYWTCEDVPGLLDFLTSRLELVPIDKNHQLVPIITNWMPSDLLAMIRERNLKYFASANWAAGEEGHLYGVIHDPEQTRLIIRYYFNF